MGFSSRQGGIEIDSLELRGVSLGEDLLFDLSGDEGESTLTIFEKKEFLED